MIGLLSKLIESCQRSVKKAGARPAFTPDPLDPLRKGAYKFRDHEEADAHRELMDAESARLKQEKT